MYSVPQGTTTTLRAVFEQAGAVDILIFMNLSVA